MVVMFSKELKEGTKKSHNAAENTKFVSQFLKGVLNPDEYVKLLTDFWYVYSTMEECVTSSTDPKVKNLQRWSAILNRTSFIERDLRYFKGPERFKMTKKISQNHLKHFSRDIQKIFREKITATKQNSLKKKKQGPSMTFITL